MTDLAAPTPAAPAAPATTETAAPAAASPETPPVDATAAKPSGKQRARDLAGKFLQGARDTAPPAEASSNGAAKAATPAEPAATAEPAKPEEPKPAKLAADDPLERSWKEVHRKKKLQRARDAEIAEQRATIAKEKAELATWKTEQAADEKLKHDDPPAWLEKHRFDFREVALREVQKQQLTPEQKAAKEEFDGIRAELAAEKAAREKAETEARSVLEEYKQERAAKAQREALVKVNEESASEWAAAKPEFPTLATYYTTEEIAETATQLRLDHYRKFKREPGFDDVFAFMEKNALAHHTRFSRQPATAAERTERETVDAQASKPRAKVRPPVTNQVAATRASPATPLTPDEKRARAVAKAAELMGPRH